MLYPRYRLSHHDFFYKQAFISLIKGELFHNHKVKQFQHSLSKILNTQNIIITPQARVGFHLYLKQILNPGDEVIISSYTLIDMANMILCAQGTPIFCDVEKNDFRPGVEQIKQRITSKTKIIVVTHLYGIATELKEIKELCDKHNILLVEDCAQSFGVKINDSYTGTIGDAAIYSFGALKNINCLFGGALLIKDQKIFIECQKTISSWSLMSPWRILSKLLFCISYDLFTSSRFYNIFTTKVIELMDKNGHIDKDAVRKEKIPDEYLCQMTSLQASLALSQLSQYENWAKTSSQIALSYRDFINQESINFKNFPMKSLNHQSFLQTPVWALKSNKEIKILLKKHLIDINIDFFRNLSQLECFKDLEQDCPNTQELLDHLALFPSYPKISINYVEKIKSALRS